MKTKTQIIELLDGTQETGLINFAANICGVSTIMELIEAPSEAEEAISQELHSFEREWNALPCDTEGATTEQDKAMDNLLNVYADSIAEICLKK